METPTTKLFLPKVIDSVPCKRHRVPNGVPCFNILSGVTGEFAAGVCNWRAKKAGFNHPVSRASGPSKRYGK